MNRMTISQIEYSFFRFYTKAAIGLTSTARIFHPFHAFKTLPFERSELVGFILGPNSSREFETKLRDEIRTRNPSVSLDRSVLSHSEYRIIIPHKFICHRDAA
jgi:hypothetical protein